MYKLSNQFKQPNNSDLFGSIYCSKNLNFDEEGYIKLSPRTMSLLSEEDDNNLGLITAIARTSGGDFDLVSTDAPYEVRINDGNGISATQDTDPDGDPPPTLTTDSHGRWFNNRWHATEASLLTYKTFSNGNWTNTAVSLTSGVRHPLEVFRNRVTLCIGNGNTVKQVDTAYTASTTLTIPADFEVTKLAYNSLKMGVATKLADTTSGVDGTNQEAYFFIWNGSDTSAGAGYSTGSDYIVDVVAYQSTFLLLTRTGQGLLFNGGGFTTVFQLPIYFTDRVWEDTVNPFALGDIMTVDGDVVYININQKTARYGNKGEEYLSPSGVMCYDPQVGLYHRWSPSASNANRLTVTAANVNTSTDVLTTTAGTIPSTGSPVKYIDSPSDEIGGLTIGEVYYCIKLTASTMQLATTREKALAGDYIDLTAQSGSTSFFLAVELVDYGASFMDRTGAVGLTEIPDLALDTIVFGSELYDIDSSSRYAHILFPCRGFRNIGYYITPKLNSQQATDFWQKGFLKHRQLKTGDKIIIKQQTSEPYGIPVTTPQHGKSCTWSGLKELYTSANLSEAKTWIDSGKELECEITAGAGAGQMSQIVEINYDSGVYSIVLEDEIEGAASSRVCEILIENWEYIATIEDTDTDYTQFMGTIKNAPFVKYKVILDGSDIKIQETQVRNKVSS